MKIKTSELEGAALDWAVAEATGEPLSSVTVGYVTGSGKPCGKFSPSTDWSQTGPLIDRYSITLNENGPGNWWSHCGENLGEGVTPLYAICRAIVAAKLGDTVDVPGELV